MRGRPSLLLVLALTLSVSRPAAADPRQEAKAHYDQGVLYYKVGKFQAALDEYSRAYELFRAPEFLFNIGQCHKNLGDHVRVRLEVCGKGDFFVKQPIAELDPALAVGDVVPLGWEVEHARALDPIAEAH